MSDLNQVFQDEDDQRQRMDWHDQQAEMMERQKIVDRAILNRIRHGETNYADYLYMVGRLNYNLNDMEE